MRETGERTVGNDGSERQAAGESRSGSQAADAVKAGAAAGGGRDDATGGAVGRAIARAHGVNANQVFNWRKLYIAGRLNEKAPATELVPVRISENAGPEYVSGERPIIAPVVSGAIHIEFGGTRIRVEGAVNPENLRMVLEQLGR